jgi:hypothetical protein
MLDIIGELQKCPQEIYPLLGKEEREIFKYGLDIYNNQNEELIENETIHKRYINRFPYLALKYLDSLKFPNLRFQLCLGNFNINQYEKQFQNELIERKLQKEIKVFDRLINYPYENDIDENGDIIKSSISKLIEHTKQELKADNNCVLLNAEGSTSWAHFSPHYNIQHNNIGISFKPLSFKGLCESGILSKRNLPHMTQPDAFLSIYELPQLVYYSLRKKDKLEEVEKYILDIIAEYKKAFNTGIEEKGKDNPEKFKFDYPKPIYSILKAKTIKPIERVTNLCGILLEENKSLMLEVQKWNDNNSKRIKSNKNRNTKIVYNIIPKGKRGAVATWMCKDIIKFCSPLVKKNIGSYVANALQESLAIFDKDKFISLIKYNGEPNSEKWGSSIVDSHPFLKYLIKYNTLFDVYENYLKNREKELIGQLKTAEIKGINKTILFDLLGVSINPLSLKSYLKSFKTDNDEHLVVNLPRGLFNPVLKTETRREIKIKNKIISFKIEENAVNEKLKNKETFSFNYLISQLYSEQQSFYKFPKTYKILDENKEPIESHVFYSIENTKEESVSKAMLKLINVNEKQIRQRKTEDAILFLILNDLSVTVLGENIFENYTLTDLFESNILERRQDFEFKIKKSDKKIRANISLRDAGNFIKLLYDKKIIEVLKYFNNPIVDYHYHFEKSSDLNSENHYYDSSYLPNIKDELNCYEKIREEILINVLKFEKFIMEWVDSKNDKNDFFLHYKKENYYNHYKDYLEPLEKFLGVSNLEDSGNFKFKPALELINKIRKFVSHNQFFEHEDLKRINTYYLVNEQDKEQFLIFGQSVLKDYYIKESQIILKNNLTELEKKDLIKKNENRSLVSIRYFKDFINGNNKVFIAEFWLVVYLYMIYNLKKIII